MSDSWSDSRLSASGLAAGSTSEAATVPEDRIGIASALSSLSTEQLQQLGHAVTTPVTGTAQALEELWARPLLLEQGMAAIKETSAMPEDAEERWGAEVAAHHCSLRDGNCMAQVARQQPALLDELRARLEDAQRRVEARKRLDAAVSERTQLKLEHWPEATVCSLHLCRHISLPAQLTFPHFRFEKSRWPGRPVGLMVGRVRGSTPRGGTAGGPLGSSAVGSTSSPCQEP